jgi:hypothetical protein
MNFINLVPVPILQHIFFNGLLIGLPNPDYYFRFNGSRFIRNIYGTLNIVLFVCRKRYLDLLTSPTSRRTILARSAVIRTLRAHLEAQGFLEVETPILSGQVGTVMNSDLDPDSPDPRGFGPLGSKSFQGFGSLFIFYGSGPRGSGWRPIRIRIQYGSGSNPDPGLQ